MAIDRLKNPFGSTQIVSGLAPENWAYASSTTGAATAYTFTGDGTAGTVNGGIYRVHRWDYTGTQTSWGITFSQAGIIDFLCVAGGGGGFGSSTNSYGGGGGAAGGMILQFDYGVTASTYTVSVGKGAYYSGVGPIYYVDANYTADDSTFGALTAVAGGNGAMSYSGTRLGFSGGSGGGGSSGPSLSGQPAGGPGTAGQGHAGGAGSGSTPGYSGGGGGGYISQGGDAGMDTNYLGGNGGDGLANYKFDGISRGYAAGGGGGGYSNGQGGTGGVGGGGDGAQNNNSKGSDASGVGCGGGGSMGTTGASHGAMGSDGMVIVRYRIG